MSRCQGDLLFKIEIGVYDANDKIYLTERIGVATYPDEEKLTFDITLSGSPVFTFRGKRYFLDSEEFGLAVVQVIKERDA